MALLGAAICFASVAGCGTPAAHLSARRRRRLAPSPPAATSAEPTAPSSPARARTAGLPAGPTVTEDLRFDGAIGGVATSGYAARCGLYPGVGYAATLDLALSGRVESLDLQIAAYSGPGSYRVGAASTSTLAAVSATLSHFPAAAAGGVVVATGGREGTLSLQFGSGRSPERVSGSWSCAPASASFGAPPTLPRLDLGQNLTVSGALAGHIAGAATPPVALVAGAPNCGAYGGSHFNLGLLVGLQGTPYLLDVTVEQYSGPGPYYPALTASDLPSEAGWATAVARPDSSFGAGRIPGASWVAVGGDFHIFSGLRSGTMFIRFMDRSGASFIISGGWSC